MDQAAKDVTSLHDALPGRGRSGNGALLVQALVRASLVVIRDIVPEHLSQVPLIDNEYVIQNLRPGQANPAFGHRVRVGRTHWSSDDLDVRTSEHRIEVRRERGIAVMDEVADGQRPVLDRPAELPRLLRDPGGSGMCRTPGQMDATRAQFDEEEHIERP